MYGKHSELEELVLLDELRFPLPRSGDLEIPAGIMHFNQAIWRVYRCKVVMGDEGSSARAMTPPPKPAKPPKSATPAYSTTTSIEPQVTHSRPPAPPPGPPPQPEHINGLSRTMLQASSPPPPPRPFPPSSASPVIQTSRTSTFPLNKEKRDFVNPLRKSAVTAGNCDSRLLAPRDNVSASSASDTEGFRPDSVMTQMSSVTMQDQDDEEASSGLYPLFENAIKQNVLSKMNRDGKFEKQLFVLTPDELIYCHLPTIKPNSVAANAMASLTGTVTDAPAAAPVAPPPARKLPLNTLMAL